MAEWIDILIGGAITLAPYAIGFIILTWGINILRDYFMKRRGSEGYGTRRLNK